MLFRHRITELRQHHRNPLLPRICLSTKYRGLHPDFVCEKRLTGSDRPYPFRASRTQRGVQIVLAVYRLAPCRFSGKSFQTSTRRTTIARYIPALTIRPGAFARGDTMPPRHTIADDPGFYFETIDAAFAREVFRGRKKNSPRTSHARAVSLQHQAPPTRQRFVSIARFQSALTPSTWICSVVAILKP